MTSHNSPPPWARDVQLLNIFSLGFSYIDELIEALLQLTGERPAAARYLKSASQTKGTFYRHNTVLTSTLSLWVVNISVVALDSQWLMLISIGKPTVGILPKTKQASHS